jgi:hypothetical protein
VIALYLLDRVGQTEQLLLDEVLADLKRKKLL